MKVRIFVENRLVIMNGPCGWTFDKDELQRKDEEENTGSVAISDFGQESRKNS